ncbi:DUF5659 domain-containing protein [Halobacillus naozhouensis]|uniref:DUF5659 domain-containing protein n=1 Tax=Halobacillus naozhouensis TaxID=554880 RepID=A0ABY8IXE7_9BACI|nr:DUF5659 domain-containing protein [Halobacillus naozhouensis]WFT74880.1 DUF5659 domain-containing protein [Halobacillus naozhouensis]
MFERKVILNVHVANRLIKKGFSVIEVKPSTRVKGRAVFIFQNTPEFSEALKDITEKGF